MNSIKKILIVGGTGYIGKPLSRKLEKDYQVEAIGSKEMNITDPESIKSFLKDQHYDLVIILASEKTNKDKMKEVNVFGLIFLMDYIKDFNISENIIYISSMMVYTSNEDNEYANSKRTAEVIFKSEIIEQGNLHGVIIRLPGVFGGNRDSGYIYNTIKRIKNNEEVIEFDNSNLDFWQTIYLKDMILMFSEFIKTYHFLRNFERFNLCYNDTTDFIKTAYLLKELMNSNCEFKFKKEDYSKFQMRDEDIKNYITIDKYSYKKALKRYITLSK